MFRFSLKQLLALVTLSSLAVVSLKYATERWQGVVGVFAVSAMLAAILACIFDRGQRRVFAIGFAVSMLFYEVFLPLSGQLPTTPLLRSLFGAMCRVEYFDGTGKQISEAEATDIENSHGSGGQYYPPMGMASGIRTDVFPHQETFLSIGHYWCALLLGYCGGHFARFVYLRRIAEQTPAEKGD